MQDSRDRDRKRSKLRLLATVVAITSLLVYLGVTQVTWPWFSLWVVSLVVVTLALGFARVRRMFGIGRMGSAGAILGGVLLFNAHLYLVETQRQRAEILDVIGVHTGLDTATVTIGAGEAPVDVRLEGSLLELDDWALALRPQTGGFSATPVRGVDMVHVRERGPLGPRWRPTLGVELSQRSPIVIVVTAGASPLQIRLARGGVRGTLVWNGHTARLSHRDPLRDRRLRRALAIGLPLAELPWEVVPAPAIAEDLVLTLTDEPVQIAGLALWSPHRPAYRLVSRSGATMLTSPGGTGESVVALTSGDTVRVISRGKRWEFAPVRRAAGYAGARTVIEFVRRPGPRGWPLPAAEDCRDPSNCLVLSSHPLPPPQAHVDLGGFGFDTARYAMLARLERGGEGLRVTAADRVLAIPYDSVVLVPASKRIAGIPDAGLLLRARRAAASQLRSVLLTLTLIGAMIVGTLILLGADRRLLHSSSAPGAYADAAWTLGGLFLILMGVRLALGLRVAYAAPYYERAGETAVGLWIAFALLLLALGRWSVWAPRLWHGVHAIERATVRLSTRRGKADVAPPSSGRTRWHRMERADRFLGARERRPLTVVGLVLAVGGLVGLTMQHLAAVQGAVLITCVILLIWITIGLARRHRGVGTFDDDPLQVITADPETVRPAESLVLLCLLAVAVVLAIRWPAVGLIAAVLVAFGAMLAKRGGAEGVAPSGRLLSRTTARVGEAMRGNGGVVLIGVVLLLAAPLLQVVGGVQGPTLRFALVFLLVLLALRVGIVSQHVFDDPARPRTDVALLILAMPLVLLFVFMWLDFGLGLVFFVPMYLTVLLATGLRRLPVVSRVLAGAFFIAVVAAAGSVLFPSTGDVRAAVTASERSARFAGVGNPVADLARLIAPDAVTRAAVRSLAATDAELLERALVFAGPSEALEQSVPALEQVWGGRAYAASGWTGAGFAGTRIFDRGVPAATSYAENAYGVYVLSEHGALGGLAVLLLYLAIILVVGHWVLRTAIEPTSALQRRYGERTAALALTVGGALWIVVPAAYVAASNLALVPLTGQNMPFLGLNAWSDVALAAALGSAMLLALLVGRRTEEAA